MSKAVIVRPDGTRVTVEGTPEEVAAMVQRIDDKSKDPTPRRGGRTSLSVPSGRRAVKAPRRPRPKGPIDYMRDLIEDDFFKTKRGIAEVKDKLEEQAHIYPITTLSPSLFRLVKAKELRRVRENKQWRYVNP
jgi:hypothetical protein